MQGTEQLREIRRVSISADKTTVCKLKNEIVRKYLSAEYVNGGRETDKLDCYGLIINIYRDLGYDLFDVEKNSYSARWSISGQNLIQENSHQWKMTDAPEIFDTVCFHNGRGVVNHVGVVIGDSRFIHCGRQGVVISRLSDEQFKNKFAGFYRLKARND